MMDTRYPIKSQDDACQPGPNQYSPHIARFNLTDMTFEF